MQTLQDVNFATGAWPKGWFDEPGRATFSDNMMHANGKARPTFLLPGNGWSHLRIEITVDPGAGGIVDFGNGRTVISVDFRSGRHRACAHEAATLAMRKQPLKAQPGMRNVVFDFDHGSWTASVDGEVVLDFDDPQQPSVAGRAQLSFWSNCRVERVHILGADALPAPLRQYPKRRSSEFHLEVTVDLPDDLYYAPYTRDMLDQLFAEYAKWGVKRCHWIYDGKESDHWWDFFPEPRHRNYLQTLENFGGDIFETAVEAAHAYGIEIYGIFKPFEMAYMLHTYGKGTEQAQAHGRFERVGGVVYRCPDFVIDHRELMTRRRPNACGAPENEVFNRIDLVGYDDSPAAFDPSHVRIYVSDDNNTYSLYEGPIEVANVIETYPVYAAGGRATGETRLARVLRFSKLEIRSAFVALTAPGTEGSFGNTLGNLVHVFGERGEERRLTLGVVPRAGQTSYDIVTATSSDSEGLDFCSRGIEFDNIEGSPTGCLTGYDATAEWHTFDGGHSFVSFARGKDETAVGVMSPSLAASRRYWLSWIGDILDAGADGVEFRQRNHHTHMDWSEFGFEAAVRDAFLERHGVDIWETNDFDLAAWRRLRGEAYTQFYREARQLVASRGKRLGMHVSRTMDIEPEQGASMGMHFDWRTWLDEGLADSVTMKEVWPQTPFAEEVLAHARPHGTKLVFSPFANALWYSPNGIGVCAERIRQAREGGYDGFQLYESCCVLRPHPNGRLRLEEPGIRELFASEFAADLAAVSG